MFGLEINISNIDLAIIGLYFLVVFGIGYFFSQRTKSGEDLFLAGRSLGWGAVGLSLFVSNISSTTLVGLTGDAYRAGIVVSGYEWMAALALIFAAFTYFPFFLRSRISTIPEFFEKRFDARSRKYFSATLIFLSIFVDTAGGLYAGALVAQVFIPGLNLTTFIIALAIIAGVYTAAGGLAAVVYTDVIQAVILIIGTLILAIITFGEFDFSWQQATQNLPEGHLSLIRPLDNDVLPWLGIIVGLPVLNIYYWTLNQYIVQRVLGAQDIKQARWGTMIAAALKLTPLFIIILPGAFATSLLPNIDAPDQVFPTLIQEYLPVGVTGLVLAGVVAAIMSSVDSALNSASTLLTLDFIEPMRGGELDGSTQRRVGTFATLGFMVVAAVWAPLIQTFPGLFAYLQSVLSYVVPPFIAIFIVGFFWPRGNKEGAFYTLIITHVVSAIAFVLTQTGVISIHFTFVAGLLLALASVLFFFLSRNFGEAPTEEKVEDLTWSTRIQQTEESVPFYLDYRLHSALILAALAVILFVFW